MINLVKDYLLPTKIIDKSGNITDDNCLLTNKEEQIFLDNDKFMTVKGKGYIILDFGKEICGGVRILSSRYPGQQNPLNIRIRFGESVSESCAELGCKNAGNYHSVRDFNISVPPLSDQEWGETGFRFVRIDFLSDEEYRFVNVYASFTHRNLNCLGSFSCSDEIVNKIYDTSKYTLFLTMQKNLIEGIKRDRLIWIGDMYPQVNGVLNLYGDDECIVNAINMTVSHSHNSTWLCDIPTYSFWFVQIICDYVLKTGKTDYALKYLPFMEESLYKLNDCVDDFGNIDYNESGHNGRFFLDWPTNDTLDAIAGNSYFFIISLNKLKDVYNMLNKEVNPACECLIRKLKAKKYVDVKAKQVIALGYLAGEISRDDAIQNITKDGANGFTTFLSPFIFKAISDCGETETAIRLMKEYYGAMLCRGATTFWEDFDIKWLENSGRIDEITPNGKFDLHGDFGKFCYKGFRHSLCHGWSCGPIMFLTEEILGIKILDEAYKKIKIIPKLGNLSWCKGEVPTPYGNIKVEHKMINGKTVSTVSVPKGIQVL